MAKKYEELSERETEVVKETWNGLSIKEMAHKMGLSPRTVETHRNNIMRKYETTNVVQMIKIALKEKIIKV